MQRAHRATRSSCRARVDEVGDCLGLRQVEAIIQKGAARELPRLGDACADRVPGLETAREQHAQHDRPTVAMQFQHGLAGVGARSGKQQDKSGVEGLSACIQKLRVQCTPRLQPVGLLGAQDAQKYRLYAAPGNADDPDATAPGRCRDGDNWILIGSHRQECTATGAAWYSRQRSRAPAPRSCSRTGSP